MSSIDQQDRQVVEPVQVLYCESMTPPFFYIADLNLFPSA